MKQVCVKGCVCKKYKTSQHVFKMRILLTDLSAEYLELTLALKSKQLSKNTDQGNSSNTKDGDGMKKKV